MATNQATYEIEIRRNDPNLKPAPEGVVSRLSSVIYMIEPEYNTRSVIDIHVAHVENGDEKAALKKLRFLMVVYDGYFDNFAKTWRAAAAAIS